VLEGDEAAVLATQRWMADVIVDLNLCPYAAKPAARGAFVYAVSDAISCEAFAADFFEAATDLLLSADDDEEDEGNGDDDEDEDEEGEEAEGEDDEEEMDLVPAATNFVFPSDPSLAVVLIAPGLLGETVTFEAFSTLAAGLEDECISDGAINPGAVLGLFPSSLP
jgi:hypothetical protein